jgi:hypothetical protein
MVCLAVLLAGCGLNLVKKAQAPEIKKEPTVNNVATSSEIIATTTENQIASSTDDMSKWKTYRSEKYGFQFKYPEKFTVVSNESFFDSGEKFEVIIMDSLKNYKFVIYLYDNGVYKTSDDFLIDRFVKNPPASEFMMINYEEIKTGEFKGSVGNFRGPDGNFKMFYFNVGEKIIFKSFFAPNDLENKSTIQGILKSFEFFDKN